MDVPADPNSPRDLKLRSEPQYGELFEDWAKDFVARTGAWPGGADYASARELAALLKTPDWDADLRVYARRLTPEEEYDDKALFVPAERLVVALRCKLERIAYYIRVNALPPVFVNEKGLLVWKHDHVGTLLALAENIRRVHGGDKIASNEPLLYQLTIPGGPDWSPREFKRQFIAENIGNLSDWQLQRIYRIIWDSPQEELEDLPDAAPRLWRDRTAAERRRGHGFISPAAFLEAVWGPWLQKGRLRESDLETRDPHLLRAYRRWIATHRRDRVKALKAPLSELERRIYSVTRDTPWSEIERIALAIVKQRQRRRKKQR